MIEIRIDSKSCDLHEGYTLPDDILLFDGDSLATPAKGGAERRVRLSLPCSPHNETIFRNATDPCAGEEFNAEYHEGIVVVDGVVMLSGQALIEAVEVKDKAASYAIVISDGADSWATHLKEKPLSEVALDWGCTLGAEAITESWGEGATVRWLPVRHDDYREPFDTTSLFPPQRAMTVADYHPFVSVEALLRAIFEAEGYEVVSDFMQSDEFRRLYISGAYPRADRSLSRLMLSSGFLAGRQSSATTTANQLGRAWLTPLVLTNSLGSFVQTTEGGDRHNNNGVLVIDDEGVEYRPKVEVSTGFEIFLKYTTECRMASSARMEGFDSLYVDAGCDLHFPLANPYPDRRQSAAAGVSYRCFVFDYEAGQQLRLKCQSDAGEQTLATFSSDSQTVTIPASAVNARCTLYKVEGSTLTEYEGDWALYDGWVERETTLDVEVTLTTPPELLSPSAAKSFNRMYLHGASEGQRITLAEECTLRPLFSSAPAEGSELTPPDILAHDATQMDLVEALQQMFNLRIATSTEAERIYIEPRDDFYRGDEVDWSSRVVLSEPMQAEYLASGSRLKQRLCYRAEGDGAVKRYNDHAQERFGEWSFESDSYLAADGVKTSRNGLFCPTISTTGIFASAPSAEVMQVGDRDEDEVEGVAARIVRWGGMRTLPADERWGYPSFGRDYPYAAFHSPEQFTLCFEDRDSVAGLNRYYTNQYQGQSRRRALRLRLQLEPHLAAALSDCNSPAGIRSRFVLNLTGQRATYNLHSVEGYDAQRSIAVCRMVRTTDD